MKLAWNQNTVHRNLQNAAERIKIVYRRQGFAALPFINGTGFLEAEVHLQVFDC